MLLPLALALVPQEPMGVFDTPVVTLSEFDAPYRLALDFDGDGDTDVLAMDKHHDENYPYADHKLALHENDGTGRLSVAWSVRWFDTIDRLKPAFVTAGNYVGDAREEFLYTWGRQVRVYQWDPGSGEAVLIGTNTNASAALDATSADFDGDGHSNPAVLLADRVQIHMPTAGGIVLRDVYVPERPWSRLLPIDADGDGTYELLLVGPGQYAWIPLGPRPRALVRVVGELLTTEHEMPAVGDIDGDGDQDAVVFGMTHYQVLRNVAGRLRVEELVPGGPATGLADIDQDGDLDGVCCGGGGSGPPELPNNVPSKFELSFNDGTGRFARAFEIEAIGSRGLAAVTDLDLDGDVELVAGRVIYYPSGPIRPPFPLLDPARNREWRTLDGDGDGDVDFGQGAGTGSENLGDGTTRASAPRLPTLASPLRYDGVGQLADLDGDGDQDLLIDKYSDATYLGLFRLENRGGEVFTDEGLALDLRIPLATLERMIVQDIDQDGRVDLVWNGWPWTIFWNDGPAGFSERRGPERVVAAGDFDRDGLLDLVLLNNYGDLGVRQGLGGRSFGPYLERYSPGAGEFISQVSLGDLTGDGALDIAFVDDSLKVLAGIPGTLDFRSESLHPPSWGHVYDDHFTSTFLQDLDLDGRPELVIDRSGFHAWPDPGVHNVVRWNGESWDWSRQMGVPRAFRDVDGDGDLDMIEKRVVLNRTIDGPRAGARLQFGDGLAGLDALTPKLGASGPFRVGETVTLRIVGGRGGASATLVHGRSRVDWIVGGLPVYVDPADPTYATIALTLDGTSGSGGTGTATVSFVVSASDAGTATTYQLFVTDPDAPGGTSASNGLELTIGTLP
jgi:hypothetical protein